MNYAGIDLASKSSAVAVVDEQGHVMEQREVATDAGQLAKVLAPFAPVSAVVESSPLAEWACQVLEDAGHLAQIIDARAAKHLMDARKKTDRRDAQTLAQIVRSGWFQPVHRKSDSARLERTQLQGRQGLVRTYCSLDSQIRGLLRAHGICLGRVSKSRFAQRVRERAQQHSEALVAVLEPLLAVYEHSLEQAEAMKKQMQAQQREDELQQQLQSVPGVGPLTAKVFASTVDDPQRFANGEQVADYAGLTPGVTQSGDRCVRGSITRQGDHLLRWHLVEAAHAMIRQGGDCRLKRWARQLAETKGAAKARVALARKLAIVLWRLWLKGERFEPEHGTTAAAA